MDLYHIAYDQTASNLQENLYFLLDQAALPDLRNRIAQTSLSWKTLFDDTRELGAENAAPVIILAGRDGRLLASRRLLEWIQDLGKYRSAIVMLSSPLDLEFLCSKLIDRLHVNLEGGLDAMLRFYDPRVLEALTISLNDTQRTWFFGIASRWWYITRVGNSVQFETAFDVFSSEKRGLHLSQAQEDELLRASELDQVLAILRTNFPELMAATPPIDQYNSVVNAFEYLKSHGEMSIWDAAERVAGQILDGRDSIYTSKKGDEIRADIHDNYGGR
jgi:hypothetical protein